MHQNDISVLHLAQDRLDGLLRVLVLPVPGIDGPHHRGHPHGTQHRQRRGILIAARRTQKRRSHAADRLDLLVGGTHLAADPIRPDLGNIFVVVGVVRHLTALGRHPPDHIGVGVHPGADHKERRPAAVGLQAVQNPAGHRGSGAVVKGQRNHRPGGIDPGSRRRRVGGRLRSLGHDAHANSIHAKPRAFLSGCCLVRRPVGPGPVLQDPVINIIAGGGISVKAEAHSFQGHLAARAAGLRSVLSPVEPAGTA